MSFKGSNKKTKRVKTAFVLYSNKTNEKSCITPPKPTHLDDNAMKAK